MSAPFRVGVVGFSRSQFDHEAARLALERSLDPMIALAAGRVIEIVSGLTNQGVPKLAYELAVARRIRTVGISARQALRVRSGVFAVDQQILVGQRFGDESAAFIAYIDALIRIGGGPQSRHEVELFREKLASTACDPATHLVEHEVAWFGSS